MRFLLAALAFAALNLHAAPVGARALPSLTPSPEFVLEYAEELELSTEQREKLEQMASEAQEAIERAEGDIRRRNDVLSVLLARDPVDEAAVTEQFEQVLSAESEAKRARFKLSQQARAVLSQKQQAKLVSLQSRPGRPRVAAPAAPAAPVRRERQREPDQEKPPAEPVARVERVVDLVDPDYGSKIRHLENSSGHEHNLYYYRDPWNADGTRMIGVRSDLAQKNWRVCLYDGDGTFIKELFGIVDYDWRLCWDRKDPALLYTWRAGSLFRYDITSGEAKLLKSFAPLTFQPSGPSCNQAGDRILIATSDRMVRTFSLPDMGDERAFKLEAPAGSYLHWDKLRYTGYANTIDTIYGSGAGKQLTTVVYDDTGAVVQKLSDLGNAGHYDYSPDGKIAWFKLPGNARGDGVATPLEIHVMNLNGSKGRLLLSVPREKAHFHNLHLSWPKKVGDWFVASFFPLDENSPHAAPYDEIAMIKLDGTVKYLAHSGTTYTRAVRKGGDGDMFWAQPLAAPSADGRRISFNSNRTGTIDQYILYTDEAPKR